MMPSGSILTGRWHSSKVLAALRRCSWGHAQTPTVASISTCREVANNHHPKVLLAEMYIRPRGWELCALAMRTATYRNLCFSAFVVVICVHLTPFQKQVHHAPRPVATSPAAALAQPARRC